MNFLKKTCPSCHAKIAVSYFRNREKEVICNECGAVLVEDSKRNVYSIIISFIGISIAVGAEKLRIPLILGIVIMALFFVLAYIIIGLKIKQEEK